MKTKTSTNEQKMKNVLLIFGVVFFVIGVVGYLVHPHDDMLIFLFGLLIGCGFFIALSGLRITIPPHTPSLDERLDYDFMEEAKPRILWSVLLFGVLMTLLGIALIVFGSSVFGYAFLFVGLVIIVIFLLDCRKAIKIANHENEQLREAQSKQ